MRFSENLNLPILQDGDKYSKEIQNEAFNTIDRECTSIKNTIKSALDISEDVSNAIKTIGDISEELSDLKEKQNEDYCELLESNNYIGDKIRDINSQFDTMKNKINVFINVKEFGVVGDGETDDTENIQKAIDFAYDNKLKLVFPVGLYKCSQIVLKDNIYEFAKGAKILQMYNIPVIVNEHIDLFGSFRTYDGIYSVNQAEKDGNVNKIIIEGSLTIEKYKNYENLSHEEQIKYKGSAWIDSTYGYMATFPINFCGLVDSYVKNITIDYMCKEANINFGFCLRSEVINCNLHQGKDNCLQFFASINCVARGNSFRDGGGGLLVMQNCKYCSFTNNKLSYTNITTGVNSYMISIKNSIGCVVNNNLIDGFGDKASIGISLTSQGGGCKGTIVTNNTIINCGIAIVNEQCDGSIIENNAITDCGGLSNYGAIMINQGNGINIIGNTLQGNNKHGITLKQGNLVKINDNIIKDIPNNACCVIFDDYNTTTQMYEIKGNTLYNETTISGAIGVWFATGSRMLFKPHLIKNNMICGFGTYVKRNTENMSKFMNKEEIFNYGLKVRTLATTPTIVNSDGMFSVVKNSIGNYTITFDNGSNRKLIIKSVNVSYKGGYSVNDIKPHTFKVTYDDSANTNNSVKSLNIVLVTNDNAVTDNPTTNPNAGKQSNFGIDINFRLQHDFSTWE